MSTEPNACKIRVLNAAGEVLADAGHYTVTPEGLDFKIGPFIRNGFMHSIEVNGNTVVAGGDWGECAIGEWVSFSIIMSMV